MFAGLLAWSGYSMALDYDLAASENDATDNLVEMLQTFVTFMLNNVLIAAVLIGFVVGILSWVLFPKGDGLGHAFRAIIGGVLGGFAISMVEQYLE